MLFFIKSFFLSCLLFSPNHTSENSAFSDVHVVILKISRGQRSSFAVISSPVAKQELHKMSAHSGPVRAELEQLFKEAAQGKLVLSLLWGRDAQTLQRQRRGNKALRIHTSQTSPLQAQVWIPVGNHRYHFPPYYANNTMRRLEWQMWSERCSPSCLPAAGLESVTAEPHKDLMAAWNRHL